jgi:hypothetical protein
MQRNLISVLWSSGRWRVTASGPRKSIAFFSDRRDAMDYATRLAEGGLRPPPNSALTGHMIGVAKMATWITAATICGTSRKRATANTGSSRASASCIARVRNT